MLPVFATSREIVQPIKLRGKKINLILRKVSTLRKIKCQTKANKRCFPFDGSQRKGGIKEII